MSAPALFLYDNGMSCISIYNSCIFLERHECLPSATAYNKALLSIHPPYLGLLVVLHGHSDDIEPNDTRDEQIQVMGGAHLVNQKSEARVIRVIWFALCLWGEKAQRNRSGNFSLSEDQFSTRVQRHQVDAFRLIAIRVSAKVGEREGDYM